MNRHPIKPWIRLLVYFLLLIGLVDYFLIHPARVNLNRPISPLLADQNLIQNLREHVNYLASPKLLGRAPGTEGNRLAERYLIQKFIQLGLLTGPAGKRKQSIQSTIGYNVYSTLIGPHANRGWVLLGAHLDHLGRLDGKDYLGADDNASSLAILLETARMLATDKPLRHFNLLFVGFNSEEPPHFLTRWMGSHHFYSHFEETGIQRTDLRFAIVMDLMGGAFWEPLTDAVFAMGAEKTPALEPLLKSTAIPGLRIHPYGTHMIENLQGVGHRIFSDYNVFRNNKVPYLFLSSGRTPHYHRPSDTAETLHYARMAKTVRWLVELIRKVDQTQTPLEYQSKRENFRQDLRVIQSLVEEASQWRRKISYTGWLSLWRLKQDRNRIRKVAGKIHRGGKFEENDLWAMRLASVHLQCLLGNMGPCFLISGK